LIDAAPPPVYPWPIGAAVGYHPTATNADVREGRSIGRLRCGTGGPTLVVHVELFARRQVAIVPPGIGVGRRCSYPLRTRTPTGVVEIRGRARYVLGDLFRVWGRRLSRSSLLGFAGRVEVFVAGRRFWGEPQAVPLTNHAQIVIELDGHVAPHPSYRFPKGSP
jgi:hypothetical protein